MSLSIGSELAVKAHREHKARRIQWESRAVPDTGIDLRRRKGFQPMEKKPVSADLVPIAMVEPSVIPITSHEVSQPVPVIIQPKDRVTVRSIQRKVCAVYGCELRDMLGPSRFAVLIRPRHIAMYLCRTILLKSFPEIGRGFGGRDHTTVLSAFNKIERMIFADAEFAGEVALLEAELTENPE